jgi:hypothetical protein
MSDDKGYFIGRTKDEAERFMEKLAKRLKAHLTTYHTLKKTLSMDNKEVEDQMRLIFDDERVLA